MQRIAGAGVVGLALALAAGCSETGTPPTGTPPEGKHSVSAAAPIVDAAVPFSQGLSINAAGVVVGVRRDGLKRRSFVWTQQDGARDVPAPEGFPYFAAARITDAGVMVGSCAATETGTRMACVRSAAGEVRTLADPSASSYATDASGSGVVVGTFTRPGGAMQGFRWSAAEGLRLLPGLSGGYTEVRAVNDRGEMVGFSSEAQVLTSQAVHWSASGELRKLPTLGGGYASAQDANNLGQVVGISTNAAGQYRAALWEPDGTVRDLGTLGGEASYAYAINERGEVVGHARTASGEGRAFFWSPKSGMLELAPLPGHASAVARGINEKGQVVGISIGGADWERAVVWQVTR